MPIQENELPSLFRRTLPRVFKIPFAVILLISVISLFLLFPPTSCLYNCTSTTVSEVSVFIILTLLEGRRELTTYLWLGWRVTRDLGGRGNKTQLLPFQSFVLCTNIKMWCVFGFFVCLFFFWFFFFTEDDFKQDCRGSADEHYDSFWPKEGEGGHCKVLAVVWTSTSALKLHSEATGASTCAI